MDRSPREPRLGDPDYNFAAFRREMFGGGLRWFATMVAVLSAALGIWVLSDPVPVDLYWPIPITSTAAKAFVIGAFVFWSLVAIVNWRAHWGGTRDGPTAE